jgi:hypothetical protein
VQGEQNIWPNQTIRLVLRITASPVTAQHKIKVTRAQIGRRERNSGAVSRPPASFSSPRATVVLEQGLSKRRFFRSLAHNVLFRSAEQPLTAQLVCKNERTAANL